MFAVRCLAGNLALLFVTIAQGCRFLNEPFNSGEGRLETMQLTMATMPGISRETCELRGQYAELSISLNIDGMSVVCLAP